MDLWTDDLIATRKIGVGEYVWKILPCNWIQPTIANKRAHLGRYYNLKLKIN